MIAAERTFDPANDTHYAMSEEHEFHLRRLAQSLRFTGQVFAQQDQTKSDNGDDDIASLFETFAFAAEGIVAGAQVVFPGRK